MLRTVLLVASIAVVAIQADCPPCSGSICRDRQEECGAASPYFCMAGPSYKGCSANPWNIDPHACTQCCDLSNCNDAGCKPCTLSQCTQGECSAPDIYLCTGGPAGGGCATHPWNTQECTGCCNAKSCPSPTPQPQAPPPPPAQSCPSCTNNECMLLPSCPPNDPYLCTQGSQFGACLPHPWDNQQGCSRCCDYKSCMPNPPPNPTPAPNTPQPQPQPTPVPPQPTPVPQTPVPPQPTPVPPTPQPPTPQPPTPAPETPVPVNPTPVPQTPVPNTPTPQTPTPNTPAPNTPPPTWPPATPAPPATPVPTPYPPAPPAPPYPSTCPPCNAEQCNWEPCPPYNIFVCTEGDDKGRCKTTPWTSNPGCSACCDASKCHATPAPYYPPPPPPDNCGLCTQEFCEAHAKSPLCGWPVPNLCTAGPATGGCSKNAWPMGHSCTACCDVRTCIPAPPPHPPNPWSNVLPSQNCSANGPPIMSPNPAATPWGGIDVSDKGCKVKVSESCCGYTPRFNWIISTCHENPGPNNSMACRHKNGNTSKVDLYYIHMYQWNGSTWNKDPTSSKSASGPPGSTINLDEFWVGPYKNETLKKQDWDIKYAPTTISQGTNGVGPPGYMVVMSAKQFSWSSLYVLNQITLNRGPGGEHLKDNCWASSSGEFDFIEPPFWGGVRLPLDRLYTTVTADSGRCLPVEKRIPSRYNKYCSDPNCCEMCGCPSEVPICFGNISDVGYLTMGCAALNETNFPKDSTFFTVDQSNTTCSEYNNGLSGGAASDAFFKQQNEDGTGEVLYVALMDGDGVIVYRWPTDGNKSADDIWKGIGKYHADDVITQRRPNKPIKPSPPCENWDEPCAVFAPSCGDDCVLLGAGGTFGLGESAGAYTAEAARDGLNWWNLFESTGQTPSDDYTELAKFVPIHHYPQPLPYYCNKSCGEELCRSRDRCPSDFPYECTEGDGFGGCSNKYNFWPLSPKCTDCCDVSSCQIECPPCTQAQCSQQTCNGLDPWFCAAGTEEGGCAATESTWDNTPGCTACCDTSACPKAQGSKADSSKKKAKDVPNEIIAALRDMK